MKQTSHNSTSSKKTQKKIDAKNTIAKRPYNKGTYREKSASDFLFFPWPANKKFFDKLAEEYLFWALDLCDKIKSEEFDPAKNWHSLTYGEFCQQKGIPDPTFRGWLDKEDAFLLNHVHKTVKNILGRLREHMALFDKANANHIRNTLGQYSQEYRDEREWLSKLQNSQNDASNVVVESPCYKEHKDECRDENKT